MTKLSSAVAALATALGVALSLAADAGAAFPGANGRIAYTGSGGLRTAFPDGSDQRLLSSGTTASWSADGRKLAFVSAGDLHVMNADGSGVTRLTSTPDGDENPSWSPDGARIVFSRFVSGVGPALFVINADGSGERALAVDAVFARNPAWSPVGAEIAFDHTQGIDVVKVDGSGQRRVVTRTSGPENSNNYALLTPNWSPDGARIVFQLGGDVRDGSGAVLSDSEVGVVNADGSGMLVLTNNGVSNSEPVWSPDGTKILYSSSSFNGDGFFHTINPDGSGDTALSFGGRAPDWGPDTDRDGDGVLDASDNCPAIVNSDQANQDGDGQGDACDPDRDGDAVWNEGDNCPDSANADQADADGDGLGDLCDADRDGDAVPDESDNCPATPNAGQEDADADGVGDACDADRDGDGHANGADNCADAPNADQANWDGDGQGDACDADKPPAQQLTDLGNTVTGLPNLPPGTHSSLKQKLQNALEAFNAGDIARACRLIESFEREVQAQAGKKITESDAAALLAASEKLKQTMGC